MEIIIIVAISQNRVIGRNNTLPWAQEASFRKADLGRFKEMTMGSPCIMGRRTWESLPKRPLPGRPNIVISRSMPDAPGATVLGSLPQSIRHCEGEGYGKAFICGGASIYQEALTIADKIELTLIHRQFDGDVLFPEIDPTLWEETGSTYFDDFSFIGYSRISVTD